MDVCIAAVCIARTRGPASRFLLCLLINASLMGSSLISRSVASGQTMSKQPNSFSPRLKTPRVAPVPEKDRTEAQREMLSSRSTFNVYTTLAHHPDLFRRWSPLGGLVMNRSSIPARHREMLMLRMGWLCQSEYEWSQHARIATTAAVLTDAEVDRIAAGPQAAGWTDFERALLRTVDELRYDAMISDATWNLLRQEYSDQKVIEALYTAANYQLVSMALNSLGVQLDAGLRHRLPTSLPLPKLAGLATGPRLKTPRVPPLAPDQWTEQQRELIAPQKSPDGSVLNLYATMLQHPVLYGPRMTFSSYLRTETSLPPQTRELLIMRTAVLLRIEYEWAHHVESARAAGLSNDDIERIAKGPEAKGWSEEHRAVLRAADELRQEAFITDQTWSALAKHYNTKQLFEIIFTVGGYTMTGLAINSLGIQLEPGYPGFPGSARGSGSSRANSR